MLEEVRTEVFTEVTSNIQNAQAKQKLYYDHNVVKSRISAGRSRPFKKHEKSCLQRRKIGQGMVRPIC